MADDGQKARDFLEGQQHYYRQLRQNKQDLKRFQESHAEHLGAIKLLNELPRKVYFPLFQTHACRAIAYAGYVVPSLFIFRHQHCQTKMHVRRFCVGAISPTDSDHI